MTELDGLNLEQPRAYSTPSWRDYHVVGPLAPGIAGVVRARRLMRRTKRLLAKKGAATAGRELAAARSDQFAGVEVECERVGLRWRLAPADLAQRCMFAGGSFEHPLVAWICSQLQPGDRVADIGAHVGLFTTQFARRLDELGGDGRVVSFEPSPDSAERLRTHVAMNGLADRVTVIEAALGAEQGHASLHSHGPADDPSRRSIFGTGATVAADVKVLRFDDWWNEAGRPAIDVVKIDVEGAELGVVQGMQEALRASKPRLLVVEIKEQLSAQAGVDTERVVSLLAACGYEVQGPFSKVVGRGPMPYLDDNFVFTRTR